MIPRGKEKAVVDRARLIYSGIIKALPVANLEFRPSQNCGIPNPMANPRRPEQ